MTALKGLALAAALIVGTSSLAMAQLKVQAVLTVRRPLALLIVPQR